MTVIIRALALLAAVAGSASAGPLETPPPETWAFSNQAPPSASQHGPGGSFHAAEAAQGVTVFIQDETMLYPVQGNIILIELDSYAVVVDSGRTPSWASAVIAEIRQRTHKPVRYLVNTHWHGDHHHGNAAFREAFPDLVVVGHADTSREIGQQGKRSLENQISMMENPSGLLSALERDDDGRGNPLRPDQKHRLRQLSGMPAEYLDELRRVELRPPSLTFREGLVWGQGNDRIEIFSNGPGNTAADAIIYLPGRKAVLTGDLLISTVPFMFGSHPRGWLARLREIAALDFEVIIPGHGPLQRDRKWLDLHIDLLETLIAEAEKAVAKGDSQQEFLEGLDLARFRQAYGQGDKSLIHEFDSRVTYSAAPSAYRETLRVRRQEQGSDWTLPLAGSVRKRSEELRRQAADQEFDPAAQALLERIAKELDGIDLALAADYHLLALQRLGAAWEHLHSAAQAYRTDQPRPQGAEAFQEHWSTARKEVERRHEALLRPASEGDDEGLTPLALIAMADVSLVQTLPYVNAAGLYAKSTSVPYGLYSLGQGQSHLRWAEWLRNLKLAEVRPQPFLKTPAGALLADLEERTGEAFQDSGLAIEMHSRFIRLNASLKKTREVLNAGGAVGEASALLPLLECEMQLNAILASRTAPSPADRQWLELENWQQRANASSHDHSLALLFLQRARATLEAAHEAEDQEESLRSAGAIVEGALPAYFSWIAPSR